MTHAGGRDQAGRSRRRRIQTWWRWASRPQRRLVVAAVVAVVAAGPLEWSLRTHTADVVRYEVERTVGASGDVDVRLGGWPFIPQVLRGSLSSVTVTLETTTCGDLALDDVTLTGSDVRPSVPYVHDLSVRAVVSPEAIQAALDRDGGEDLDVTIDTGRLAVTAPADDRGHPLEVAVVDHRRVTLAVDDSTLAGTDVTERIADLSFDTSCPVSFGWIDAATVDDAGIVLTGQTAAAALYEREAP